MLQPFNLELPPSDNATVITEYENGTWSADDAWARDDPWLLNILSGGSDSHRKQNSSLGYVVELSENVSFVSVLGKRDLRPGWGGECRFVFDPPFVSSGLHWRQTGELNYTYADTGNPTFINVSYPNNYPDQNVTFTNASVRTIGNSWPQGQAAEVKDVHLLDQQLDPTVRYKMGIFRGPKGEGGVIGVPEHPEQLSPGDCIFDSIAEYKQ